MAQKLTPDSTSYEAKLTLLELQMLYRTMLVRIANKYSPEELAFLVGKDIQFIHKMEMLQNIEFRLNELCRNLWLASEIRVTALFPTAPVEEKMGNYRLTKTIKGEFIVYRMDRLLDDDKIDVLFILQDDNPEIDFYKNSTADEKKMLEIAIQSLIDLNYFDKERMPWAILAKCKTLLSDTLKPKNLYEVLTTFTKQKTYPKLLYKSSKQLGYHYVLAKKA